MLAPYAGLSLTSIATETLCYTATLAYNINHVSVNSRPRRDYAGRCIV